MKKNSQEDFKIKKKLKFFKSLLQVLNINLITTPKLIIKTIY